MSVKDVNKLGEEINSVKNKSDHDVNSLLYNLPRSIDIIESKKSGAELVYLKEYEDQGKIYDDIIKRYKIAWSDMLKLIEEFAIKEQGKKKPIKKKPWDDVKKFNRKIGDPRGFITKKPKRRAKKKDGKKR